MSQVSIQIIGLDKLIALGEKYPATSEKYINNAINRSLVRVLGEEKQQAPVSTGNLRDNWSINLGRFTGSLVSNAPYASAVENGSRPHMPPATNNAFVMWCNKKGLNPWAVARNIAKNGTKPNPFLQRAVDLQKDNINGEFKNALDSVLSELTK